MMPELRYRENGPAMNPEPSGGISLSQAADWFVEGKPVFLILEPGDATRYELMLVPHVSPHAHIPSWGTSLVVTVIRYRSGHAIEADNFRWPYEGMWVLENLGSTNKWTKVLLDWWLREFAAACKQFVERRGSDSAKVALAPTKIGNDIIAPTHDVGLLCTRNYHVVPPRPWRKHMACQCNVYYFYRVWHRTEWKGSQAENGLEYHAIMNSERPIQLQVKCASDT